MNKNQLRTNLIVKIRYTILIGWFNIIEQKRNYGIKDRTNKLMA